MGQGESRRQTCPSLPQVQLRYRAGHCPLIQHPCPPLTQPFNLQNPPAASVQRRVRRPRLRGCPRTEPCPNTTLRAAHSSHCDAVSILPFSLRCRAPQKPAPFRQELAPLLSFPGFPSSPPPHAIRPSPTHPQLGTVACRCRRALPQQLHCCVARLDDLDESCLALWYPFSSPPFCAQTYALVLLLAETERQGQGQGRRRGKGPLNWKN